LNELSVIERWKNRGRQLKVETYTLIWAYRDPRVPWHAKLFVACVVGYAFSPIDLIPDFIPVLGYLDDLILVPLGVMLALRMIPADVLEDSRKRAQETLRAGRPRNWTAGAIIVGLWLLLIAVVVAVIIRAFRG
jgi:uncharacterized membrane protein YkvA (DUF1232 family)